MAMRMQTQTLTRTKVAVALAVVVAVMALAAACGGDAADPLAGTSWSLISLGPAGFPEPAMFGVQVTAEFSEDGTSFRGSGGCNSFSGTYQVDGEAFSHTGLSWTEIGCITPEGIFEQETRFFDLLAGAESFTIKGLRLTLHAPDDEILIFLRTGE